VVVVDKEAWLVGYNEVKEWGLSDNDDEYVVAAVAVVLLMVVVVVVVVVVVTTHRAYSGDSILKVYYDSSGVYFLDNGIFEHIRCRRAIGT